MRPRISRDRLHVKSPPPSRGVLLRQGPHTREALQTFLVDRVDCTPVLVAGTRGYAFTGDGTIGGLLAASTWPTTSWWPQRDSNPSVTLQVRGIVRVA